MKRILMTAVLAFSSTSSFGAAASFLECSGFAGVDEYRAGIDLTKKVAGFFDNDSTSKLAIKSVKTIGKTPRQTVMVFEGRDESGSGTLRLTFNLTHRIATMHSIADGKTLLIGSTNSCAPAKPWSL
jgi:hypothetical protein